MKSFTVKLPAQREVDSARAQCWLRDYFVHPLALPLDPGAGERAVCLVILSAILAASNGWPDGTANVANRHRGQHPGDLSRSVHLSHSARAYRRDNLIEPEFLSFRQRHDTGIKGVYELGKEL